jgi:XTP/dITP diphosphohydrolase
MKLIIASNNKGKIREYKQLLEPFGYDVVSQSEAGINIEVEETGTTFAENSALKAQAIYDLTKSAVLADDSGLVVDALGGEPGVYSARYGGCDNDADRVALILDKMKNIGQEDRTAHFVCTICFIKENGEHIAVEGRVYGKIGYEPLGENGFGYDPIFMYEGKSFAQLSAEDKNRVSHRANALKALTEKLREQKGRQQI